MTVVHFMLVSKRYVHAVLIQQSHAEREAAAGAVLGAVAWSRTPSGAVYPRGAAGAIVEVGLPAVVVMVMTGIAINSFIVASRTGGI